MRGLCARLDLLDLLDLLALSEVVCRELSH